MQCFNFDLNGLPGHLVGALTVVHLGAGVPFLTSVAGQTGTALNQKSQL
jgi:hypothetical protein